MVRNKKKKSGSPATRSEVKSHACSASQRNSAEAESMSPVSGGGGSSPVEFDGQVPLNEIAQGKGGIVGDGGLVCLSASGKGGGGPSLPAASGGVGNANVNISGPGNRASYAQAVSKGVKKGFMNRGVEVKLRYTKPTEERFTIKISDMLPVEKVWGWALLGQYVGPFPGHAPIITTMRLWGVKSKYRVEEGWIIFEFDSEDDKNKVLLEGPYFIFGRPLIVKDIPDKFAFRKQDVATVPSGVIRRL